MDYNVVELMGWPLVMYKMRVHDIINIIIENDVSRVCKYIYTSVLILKLIYMYIYHTVRPLSLKMTQIVVDAFLLHVICHLISAGFNFLCNKCSTSPTIIKT